MQFDSHQSSIIFSKSYFPDVRGGVHGFGFAPQNQRRDQPAAQQNRFFSDSWGRGQPLGRN